MIYKDKKDNDVDFSVSNFPFSSTIKHEIKGLNYAKLCEFEDWCLDILGDEDGYTIKEINEILEENIDDFSPCVDDYCSDDY